MNIHDTCWHGQAAVPSLRFCATSEHSSEDYARLKEAPRGGGSRCPKGFVKVCTGRGSTLDGADMEHVARGAGISDAPWVDLDSWFKAVVLTYLTYTILHLVARLCKVLCDECFNLRRTADSMFLPRWAPAAACRKASERPRALIVLGPGPWECNVPQALASSCEEKQRSREVEDQETWNNVQTCQVWFISHNDICKSEAFFTIQEVVCAGKKVTLT